jgi:hypothetical protein
VHVFRQKFTLEDAIGSHAFAPLEDLACVLPMAFLSAAPSLLVHTAYCVHTPKDNGAELQSKDTAPFGNRVAGQSGRLDDQILPGGKQALY